MLPVYLVLHRMQNAKYQILFWNNEIQNAKIPKLCLVLSKIQNLLPLLWPLTALLGFSLPVEAKIQNIRIVTFLKKIYGI